MDENKNNGITISVSAETTEIDTAIEKAKQLKALLVEVKELINSLNPGKGRTQSAKKQIAKIFSTDFEKKANL